MNEVYTKLNYYLNEICNYLKKSDSFLLDNINRIALLNDNFNSLIYKYNLNYEVKKNNLTFLDVYNLAREIIGSIDESYLPIYDKLISSGELDFGYDEDNYEGSLFREIVNGKYTQKIINIKREFNYHDVVVLIHEFIHYISYREDNIMFHYLCEFLAIYFETYAINYLVKKGIPKEEIDYLSRFKSFKMNSNKLFDYEIILLVYNKFGNISDTSFDLLEKFYVKMPKESFQKDCKNFYNILEAIKEKNKFKLQDKPDSLGEIFCEEYFFNDYQYILGTILAIYVFEFGNMKDVVYLNNHLEEFKDKSVSEACLTMGVDLNDPGFGNKAMIAFSKYLNSLEVSKSR